MKIIYHCFGGTHSSITAAAIHLGWLPGDKVPPARWLMELPYYDKRDGWDRGEIVFMGMDEKGHEIYAVGRGSEVKVLTNLIDDLAKLLEIPAGSYRLVDVMKQVNLLMKLGGFTSRRLKAVIVGRPVVVAGTRLAFKAIKELVDRIKEEVA